MIPADLENEEHIRDHLREGTILCKKTVTLGEQELLEINETVAFPVYPASKYFIENSVFDIPIRLSGREIGTLCLISKITPSENVVASLTEAQYTAYITATDSNGIISGAWIQPNTDYVVIKNTEIENYFKNIESAPLWGGFTHTIESNESRKGKVSTKSSTIDIIENCKPRTKRHQECLDIAAKSNHATERFLHLYHYLELDYDYEIVNEIRQINDNDPKNLWDILKLSREDTDRIYHILRNYNSIQRLEPIITKLRNHKSSALRIFYEYGKESNPLKNQEDFLLLFINSPTINRLELERIKKSEKIQDKFTETDENYKKKIIKLICYWIYRVRCSIAHNKLGEYHLNDSDDLEFLIDFAEPLLNEMISFRTKQ